MATLTLKTVILEFLKTDKELIKLTDKTVKLRAGRSQHLFEVAQQYDTADLFIDACSEAEESILESNSSPEQMPRSWINAKSNIKRALQFQQAGAIIPDSQPETAFVVSDYDTESAMRADLTKVRKAYNLNEDGTVTPKESAKPEVNLPTLEGDLQLAVGELFAEISKIAEEFGEEKALGLVHKAMGEAESLLADLVPSEPEAPSVEEVA